MTTRKLTYYTDPTHGWLAVPRADLATLGIAANVSRYSYQRGARAYLEEDCDASLYLEAAKAAGWRVTMREQYSDDCPVEGFDRYQAYNVMPLFDALDQLNKLQIVHIKG